MPPIQGIEACKANQHVRNMSSCREQYSKDAFIAVLFIHLGFYVSVQSNDIWKYKNIFHRPFYSRLHMVLMFVLGLTFCRNFDKAHHECLEFLELLIFGFLCWFGFGDQDLRFCLTLFLEDWHFFVRGKIKIFWNIYLRSRYQIQSFFTNLHLQWT